MNKNDFINVVNDRNVVNRGNEFLHNNKLKNIPDFAYDIENDKFILHDDIIKGRGNYIILCEYQGKIEGYSKQIDVYFCLPNMIYYQGITQ